MSDLLTVEQLGVQFRTDEGMVPAVEQVSFRLERGKTLGLVGESGSGKSVATKALMRLLPANARLTPASQIRYTTKAGRQLAVEQLSGSGREVHQLRGGEIGMIFQEPMASFSPVYTVGHQIVEAIRLHRPLGRRAARAAAIAILDKVGITNPDRRIDQYPHELSGGMRQRAMIALALVAEPALLIADEPTTALDVTIQAQVLELMRELQQQLGMAMIFISHDLGVIAQIADEVAVMYLGSIIERGPVRELIRNPKHPYTRGLLAAIPSLTRISERLTPVPGDIPSPMDRPSGCAFRSRCPEAMSGICDRAMPPETGVGEHHTVRCYLYGERG